MKVLEGITTWMSVNSEGIYGSRPWKIYGEGPSTLHRAPGAQFNESKRNPLTADDIRFTTRGPYTLYVFVMGWPAKETVIRALGTSSVQSPRKVARVELLGYRDTIRFGQEPSGLRVQLPDAKPSDFAITLKVTFA